MTQLFQLGHADKKLRLEAAIKGAGFSSEEALFLHRWTYDRFSGKMKAGREKVCISTLAPAGAKFVRGRGIS